MPGPSGLELQLALSKRADSLPVVFLTGHGDIPMSVLAIQRGAVDFLTKPFDREQLLSAIGAALRRDAEGSEQKRKRSEVRRRFDSLTPREKVVFSQVISGKLNKQIAGTLGTCERTVKAHRAHVMEKMQVHSVAGLVHLSLALADGDVAALLAPARIMAEQAA
jgi:FixJ family two-component response regulator